MINTTTPITHTFRPWSPGPNNTRILASQRKWAEVEKWNRHAESRGWKTRVDIGECDLFEPWDDNVCRDGHRLLTCDVCGKLHPDTEESDSEMCDCGRLKLRTDWATMSDIRRDLFRLNDATPHLIWVLKTRFPGNVKAMVYDQWTEKVPGHVSQNDGDGRRWKRRPNVHLYARITDQPTADALVPELLKLRDLVSVLGVDGVLTGPVDFERHFGSRWERKIPCQNIFMPPAIKHVRIRGETGPDARPLHPQWVRDARDQCVAAGVKFAFDGWGEWLPAADIDNLPESAINNGQQGRMEHWWMAQDGDVWPNDPYPKSDARERRGIELLVRVGSAKSGRLLDGREWLQFPEVTT